jgi:hypothetical protein
VGVARAQVVGMDAFASLSRREQLGRLRRVGRTALASYGLEDARLTLQRYEQNTTFRVDAREGPYLLRINRPRVQTPDTIGSEMAWLSALRRDTDLGVPEPVAARDGSFVILAGDPGVPEPHVCVLLRWLDGRFINQRLAPAHLWRVGALAGKLQEYACVEKVFPRSRESFCPYFAHSPTARRADCLLRPLMRMRGLEPPRGCPHTDLNRARLPIPPHPRGGTV